MNVADWLVSTVEVEGAAATANGCEGDSVTVNVTGFVFTVAPFESVTLQ